MSSGKPYHQQFASHGTITCLRQEKTNRRPYKVVQQQHLQTNKQDGLNSKSSDFYLGGFGFEFQTGHQLYWFVSVVVSLKFL